MWKKLWYTTPVFALADVKKSGHDPTEAKNAEYVGTIAVSFVGTVLAVPVIIDVLSLFYAIKLKKAK